MREYYCSKVSPADNFLQPIDLVMLSGTLSGEYEVDVIDAVAGRLTVAAALDRIRAIRPDVVISLIGSVSLAEDLQFFRELRASLPIEKLVVSGDVFIEEGGQLLRENEIIDAALLDFTSRDILYYLAGQYERITRMHIRDKAGVVKTLVTEGRENVFAVPPPRHELFMKYDYRHALIHGHTFATTIIDFGCPFPCSFCIMNNLGGYKYREVDNILAELRVIKKLGIPEIFFHTQTFGANKAVAAELCRRMIAEKLGFGWVCFSRVDVAAPDLLDLMKAAGCHGIIFGVESGSEKILRLYRKQYNLKQIMATTDYCDRIGIETTGTFILGLPEESHETMRETLELLKRIKLDFAGINVAVPRGGTDLRKEAMQKGWVAAGCRTMDQSGTSIAMPTNHLTREDLEAYRKKAVSTFYFRPSYFMRRLRKIKKSEITKTLKNAAGLIRTTWWPRDKHAAETSVR